MLWLVGCGAGSVAASGGAVVAANPSNNSKQATAEVPTAREATAERPGHRAGEAPLLWSQESYSPGGRRTVSEWPSCPQEARMDEVAGYWAAHLAEGQPTPDLPEVQLTLRAAGVPHVWPRFWTVEGPVSTVSAMRSRLSRWVGRIVPLGQLRCGVGQVLVPAESVDSPREATAVLVAVVVDAVAELSPLPTRARSGQLLTLLARGLVATREGRVVLLGPSGRPLSHPATSRDNRFRSTFHLPSPGLWKVQLVAELPSGPRPLLEAWIAADREPPAQLSPPRAPGEKLAREIGANTPLPQARAVVVEMLNHVRRAQHLPPLHRLTSLDAVAQRQAEAMRDSGLTAHDAGAGPLSSRLLNAGLSAGIVGENVAHAGDLRRAHRALYDSPSHRQTLLHEPFRQVGVGVAWARGEGPPAVWLATVFVDHGTVLR